MKRKINKEKISKTKERLRKLNNKVDLNYVFTFGKHKGNSLSYVIRNDLMYMSWLINNKVLNLSREVLEYYVSHKRQAEKEREEYEAKLRKEREAKEKAERERREREQENDDWYNTFGGFDSFNDFFRSQFTGRGSKTGRSYGTSSQRATQPEMKVVSPACQWDHLPENVKHGKVLGFKGQIKKSEIKSLYKKRMLEYHPDKCEVLGEELQKLAHEMTIKINEAYEYFKRSYDI